MKEKAPPKGLMISRLNTTKDSRFKIETLDQREYETFQDAVDASWKIAWHLYQGPADKFWNKFKAMHRRAQRAESEVAKLKRAATVASFDKARLKGSLELAERRLKVRKHQRVLSFSLFGLALASLVLPAKEY